MTTPSQIYWQERSQQRLVASEQLANQAILLNSKVYDQALRNIQDSIRSIYSNYSEKGLLSVGDLKKALTPLGRRQFLVSLEKAAKRLGIPLSQVYDQRYLSRLTRLEALKAQIRLEALSIAPQEEKLSKELYSEVLQRTYKSIQLDLQRIGFSPSFSTLDQRAIDTILRAKWEGGNYSSRIWNNLGQLSNDLPVILGSGIASGESYEKTARKLRERFNVKRYEAVRLIRTETNYFNNQAEAQSYLDDGIEEYTLDVTLDGRTSEICRNKDETKIYKTINVIVGVNFPPFHSNCRTVPRAVLRGDVVRRGKLVKPEDRLNRFTKLDDGSTKKDWKDNTKYALNPTKGSVADLMKKKQSPTMLRLQRMEAQLEPVDPEFLQNIIKTGSPAMVDRAKHVLSYYPADSDQVAIFKDTLETLAGVKTKLSPHEKKLIDNGLEMNYKSLTKEDLDVKGKDYRDILGHYSKRDNRVSFTEEGLKETPSVKNEVFYHEMGHAVDWNSRGKDTRPSDAMRLVPQNEIFEIRKRRIGIPKGFSRQDLEDFYDGKYVYGTKIDRNWYNQMNAYPELFAEGYSIYRSEYAKYKDKLPELFKLYDTITEK